jgi:hypothetical protein
MNVIVSHFLLIHKTILFCVATATNQVSRGMNIPQDGYGLSIGWSCCFWNSAKDAFAASITPLRIGSSGWGVVDVDDKTRATSSATPPAPNKILVASAEVCIYQRVAAPETRPQPEPNRKILVLPLGFSGLIASLFISTNILTSAMEIESVSKFQETFAPCCYSSVKLDLCPMNLSKLTSLSSGKKNSSNLDVSIRVYAVFKKLSKVRSVSILANLLTTYSSTACCKSAGSAISNQFLSLVCHISNFVFAIILYHLNLMVASISQLSSIHKITLGGIAKFKSIALSWQSFSGDLVRGLAGFIEALGQLSYGKMITHTATNQGKKGKETPQPSMTMIV